MFSSKTPRDLNHDPLPSRNPYDGSRWPDDGGWSEMIHDPRPEFDHVQHNPPNPILTRLRSERNAPDGFVKSGNLARLAIDFEGATAAHIDHARRVLTRLAQIGASA